MLFDSNKIQSSVEIELFYNQALQYWDDAVAIILRKELQRILFLVDEQIKFDEQIKCEKLYKKIKENITLFVFLTLKNRGFNPYSELENISEFFVITKFKTDEFFENLRL